VRVRQAGVTLVELLVSVGVAATIVLAGAQLHGASAGLVVEGERFGRVAEKVELLPRILHRELASAGDVACGAATPLYGEGGTGGAPVRAETVFGGSALTVDEDGTVEAASYRRPRSLGAFAYRRVREQDPETPNHVAVELAQSQLPPDLAQASGPLWVGDCRRLLEARLVGSALSASGRKKLILRLPVEAPPLAEEGVIGPKAWASTGGDAQPRKVRLRADGAATGVDGVPTLRLARSAREAPQPVLRGVTRPEWRFAVCPGADEPGPPVAGPAAFEPADRVESWDRVCAVRLAVEVQAFAKHGAPQGRPWPVTVTVPVAGRLP